MLQQIAAVCAANTPAPANVLTLTPADAVKWRGLTPDERRAVAAVSPANPSASLISRQLLTKWPTYEEFCQHFSYSNLTKWLKVNDIAGFSGRTYCLIADNAPTFGILADMYGRDRAAAWLSLQFYNFVKLLTIDPAKKPTPPAMASIAEAWVGAYPDGKVTELWAFFGDVLAGADGQLVYGNVELANLGARYRDFIARRNKLADEWRRKIAKLKQLQELTTAETVPPTDDDKRRMAELMRSPRYRKLPPPYQSAVYDFCKKYNLLSE